MPKVYVLKNKSRSPITVELPGTERPQVVRIVGRDPATGAVGPREETRSFPESITVFPREHSAPLSREAAQSIARQFASLIVEEVDAEAPAPGGTTAENSGRAGGE